MQRLGYSRTQNAGQVGVVKAVPTLPSPPAVPVLPDDAELSPHEPPPIYGGASRLIDWKNTARGGMTVDIGLRDVGPMDIHPFKGLTCGKDHGHRLRVIIRSMSLSGTGVDREAEPIYAGEAILMRWGDDSLSGMMARLLLDAGPDGTDGKHPFEGMVAGRKEGEAIDAVVWVIGDDERAQHPARVRRRTPFYELNEIKQSQILCRDQRFVSYLAKNEHRLTGGEVQPRPSDNPSGFAAEAVRRHLGIESRSVLGHETAEAHQARTKWRLLLQHYFQSWSPR